MIRIEQIRELENKVHAAVSRIHALSNENDRLKESLQGYEARINDLQEQVAAFKNDQDEIEAGIVAALEHLDALEDGVGETAPPDDVVTADGSENEAGPEMASEQGPTKPDKRSQVASDTTAVEEPETYLGDEEEDPELDIF